MVAAALSAQPVRAATLSIAVSGNHLVNGNGQIVRLNGVNTSGTEYMCIGNGGIFDGPSDATSVVAIASWHTTAIRVNLNEDCWLNINMGGSPYGGAIYQNAVVNYVNLLHQYGQYVILDLHWNAPGTSQATGQQVMADADHSPAMWASVAAAFKNDPAVLFDLYNEPHDIDWNCLLNGCNVGWQTAGMQSMLNAVRNAGARQPIMVGGIAWATDLTQWFQYKPNDPLNALVASFHVYNITSCATQSCWDSTVAPVAQRVPVVSGELGEDDCAHGFIDTYMNWADPKYISYLGWSWNPYNCGSHPALITAYDGTPTNFGIGLRDHLAQLAGTPLPTPAPTPTPTPTPAPTPTPTPAPTPTPTPAPTPTPTPIPASTPTPTPAATPTPTPAPLATPTPTPAPTPTPPPAATPTPAPLATPTSTPAPTAPPAGPTPAPTLSHAPTPAPTASSRVPAPTLHPFGQTKPTNKSGGAGRPKGADPAGNAHPVPMGSGPLASGRTVVTQLAALADTTTRIPGVIGLLILALVVWALLRVVRIDIRR
jgi:hypothetical protein